ncbi:ABC transporter substrate-binding protein [Sutcliffiella horikoshii]|uniref:ABC transporter substrate-binding protein n=1 Tax=Sutcliffiella horikoshii TaxID=79883 RepID=A0ABN4ZIF4_9BACI|nr:extracellular solute-binding protein [Sutcliffiella horikoshii]ART78185.1 ABC transporter substrate-binding protein [Sutcliffiella horikoshii]
MKKFLLTLITAVTVFGLIACSNETTSDKEKENSGDGTTIRVVYKDETNSNPVSVKYFDELEKALEKDKDIKVNFELVDLPQGNYAEKLTLLLYGGDIPDMIYFQGGDQSLTQQGLLEDLTPYIEESEYLKDALSPYNQKRLENYPYLLWIKPLSAKTPVIRKDWFEQMETSEKLMADPTVENYHAFFKELVEKKPGGSTPNYAVTVAGDLEEINFTFNMAFGISQSWLEKSDGTYEYYKVSKNEKEKIAYYQKLYEDGLLDPQFVTKQWDTKEKAFYDGEAAVVSGTAGKVIDIYNGKMKQVNGDEAELVVLPPAKGIDQGFGVTDVTKESRGVAISSQSEHKELVFDILDYLASPEGQKLDRLGFEGEHYNVKDGEIEVTEKYYGEWYARFWEPTELTFDQPLKTPLLSGPATESQEMTIEYFKEDNSFILPEEYVANWDAMENLYREYTTDIITGKRPIDDFDKFVDAWMEAGGTQITEYANKTIK